MPTDLVARINELSVQALKDPALAARYAELGAQPFPTSTADITAYRDKEEARLLPVIKAAGITPS
jgi:tripartite-type tricarboxylate transporter receptor subunit TctC